MCREKIKESLKEPPLVQTLTAHKKGGLGQLPSNAICGNDITSSCLYVSALAIIYSGKWAPFVLLPVGGVLYLYRGIYAEVVSALPLNGGTYNALLNTTTKYRASIAAFMILTIIGIIESSFVAIIIFLLHLFTLTLLLGIGRQLSEQWQIPPNLMFKGSPGTHLIYGLADLGGVRLIR